MPTVPDRQDDAETEQLYTLEELTDLYLEERAAMPKARRRRMEAAEAAGPVLIDRCRDIFRGTVFFGAMFSESHRAALRVRPRPRGHHHGARARRAARRGRTRGPDGDDGSDPPPPHPRPDRGAA
jgi:hypothetical protein